MPHNKTHPALEALKKKMKIRYILSAACLVICIGLFAAGMFITPKTDVSKLSTFSVATPVDTLVKSEVVLTSAMFEQDTLDDNGVVNGTNYHILAVDSKNNKFILTAPKEYYEENLKKLEDNAVKDIETEEIEILDPENKVEIYGYSREMSANLRNSLDEYAKGYESEVFTYSLELVEDVNGIPALNPLKIAAGFMALIAACVLLAAVMATADYSRKKEKLEKKLLERNKKK